MGWCRYLLIWKGRWLEKHEAYISLEEPCLLYGGLVYETLRTYNRKLFAGKYHFDRLKASAGCLHIKIDMDYENFRKIISEGVEKVNCDVSVRIMLLPRGNISAFGFETKSYELIIFLEKLNISKFPEKVKVSLSKVRKIDDLATPAYLKIAGRTDILLAKMEKGDAYDVIMLGSKGQVCEGTFSNVFLVKNNTVVTPSLDSGILPGITRKNVIDLCKSLGITVEERWVEPIELCDADELFLTHTSRGVVPVDELSSCKTYSKSVGRFLVSKFEEYIGSIEENWL
ncbi:MAG: branched-chain amino acid aminotransferase [Pseudothermotoga sp.]|nr:branched-chain amino acid aminotransferase [Pseudothermotoga sp.]MDK2883727.1 branched-chain amino acid aminotransferase [Pseudothermotoga sp.]HBJ80559.1 aminotransferase IV [Pseudothermotoga sp.]HBT26607.1 aminotransferase IV [Pseudothermotoga sp.]